MKRILFTTTLFFSFAFSFSQTSYQKSFSAIDSYIDSLMKDWNIPGLALGIVYKDQLIYSKGYGYRDLEKKLPVQTNTLFPIASNTKLFTATAAVMLEEEGKLNLDKPVRTYMPTLTFYNDDLNAHVTLRDMLTHRTGLPAYDFIWAGTDFTRKEAISKVSLMKPVYSLREGYNYNNMMYVASGAVMEAVTGKSWEEIIQEKLLNPLQMKSSVFSAEDMKKSGNYALAYFEKDSTRHLAAKMYEAQTPALGPAGTMKSSVDDMSHWMIAQLNQGVYGGKVIVSQKAITETMAANTLMERTAKYDELSNSLYGLGRWLQTYKGLKVASHTGSIDGFYSNLTFIPGANIGIFMVHNSVAAGSIRSIMAFPVIDRLLGLSFTPWSARYLADYKKGVVEAKRSTDSIKNNQVKGTVPSHPLPAYAGTYISPLYGEFKVAFVNNGLQLTVRKVTAPLNHLFYNYFSTDQEATDSPSFKLNFLTNSSGEIDRIAMGSGATEELFVKRK